MRDDKRIRAFHSGKAQAERGDIIEIYKIMKIIG